MENLEVIVQSNKGTILYLSLITLSIIYLVTAILASFRDRRKEANSDNKNQTVRSSGIR